jgi:D-alanyl-D-alanine carboxypeptidase/D-alanyl-D-alanine-endopeptidase (penicillin-binding protein 4)
LRELLTKRGIKLGGEKVVRAAVPPGARQLSSHYSPPLGVIVREVNKTSNNFMAEQLLKTLGAEVVGKPGTWPKGVQAVAKYLDGIGIAEAGYKMVNGSGLYDADRFTPAQFVELLRHTYRDFRFAADFVGSLAVAGTDGTIGHRMEGSTAERWVRAKTGTLSGVSCLSGYAGAPGHLPLAFSILMNTVGETATGDARKAQDAIAESLVTFLGPGK